MDLLAPDPPLNSLPPSGRDNLIEARDLLEEVGGWEDLPGAKASRCSFARRRLTVSDRTEEVTFR